MSRRRRSLLGLVVLAVLVAWRWPAPAPGSAVDAAAAAPRLVPALDGVVLPPNIAAPAVRIEEPGDAWHAEARGEAGPVLRVSGRRPGLVFPARGWRRLLAANAGGRITLTIAVRQPTGRWLRYAPVAVRVAAEPIDRYLTYRLISPLYNWSNDVGVYQRDLTTYRTRLVLHGRQYDQGCVNCHTPCQGSGDRFSLGVRTGPWGNGTLIVADGEVLRLDQAVGYGTWHPSGRMAVYSVNQVRQFFHAAGPETRDVLDLRSGLVCFDLASRSFSTAPALAPPDAMTTYPCWSPDGATLYFAQAQRLWDDTAAVPPPRYREVRYSLMRVSYDACAGTWGKAEELLSGVDGRCSYVFPRVSPDGRYLLYTRCDYGCFPIHRANSDLGLLDLETGRAVPVGINSEAADTWHTWSRDGHWIVFASKRADGLFTKLYLSHFDGAGVFGAPLQLPQRDPWFDETFWHSFNVPELTCEPVAVSAGTLGRAVRGAERLKPTLPPEVAPPRAAAPSLSPR